MLLSFANVLQLKCFLAFSYQNFEDTALILKKTCLEKNLSFTLKNITKPLGRSQANFAS